MVQHSLKISTFQTIVLILFVLFLSQPCIANQEIVIVRGQDFPPYHYLNEDGVEKGFIIEIIKGTGDLMGKKILFKQYPWSRCISLVKKGHVDGMMNLFKTEEREKFMHFSNNILAAETNSLFSFKHSNISYSGNLTSISSNKIGTIRNYSYGEIFDAMEFPKKFEFETEKNLINGLINNRVDLIIGNKITIQILLKQLNFKHKIKRLQPDVSNEPLYLGFSKAKANSDLANSFSENLIKFRDSKQYKHIIKSYFP